MLLFICLIFWVFAFTMLGVTYRSEWFMGTVVVGGLLFIALILWPVTYYSEKANIQAFKSVQQTIETARQQGETYVGPAFGLPCAGEHGARIESAAFQMKIADVNMWLVKMQYWNETIFDIFIPDEVMALQPIK